MLFLTFLVCFSYIRNNYKNMTYRKIQNCLFVYFLFYIFSSHSVFPRVNNKKKLQRGGTSGPHSKFFRMQVK